MPITIEILITLALCIQWRNKHTKCKKNQSDYVIILKKSTKTEGI